MISSDGLKAGDKMPTERQMAIEFGVNRSSLRQALKVLVAKGVLVQRQGSGTYISQDSAIALSPSRETLLRIAFEICRTVEPDLAARAALNRTEADLIELMSAIGTMNSAIDVGMTDVAIAGALRFYRRLWEAAGEPMVSRVLEPIHLTIAESIEASWPLSRYKKAGKQLARVFTAVSAMDPDTASRAITIHLKATVARAVTRESGAPGASVRRRVSRPASTLGAERRRLRSVRRGGATLRRVLYGLPLNGTADSLPLVPSAFPSPGFIG